jgi:hypothetical protein
LLQLDRFLYSMVCFDGSHSYSSSILSITVCLTRAELTWFIAIQVEILHHLCRKSSRGIAYKADNCFTCKVKVMKYGQQVEIVIYMWMCALVILRTYIIDYIAISRILGC